MEALAKNSLVTRRDAGILLSASRRGYINAPDSLIDTAYYLTTIEETSGRQIIADKVNKIVFHIQDSRYDLAQAIIDGKEVKYGLISSSPEDEYGWVIK